MKFFPVTAAPGAAGAQLHKAVADDGPNSPWAETILEGLAHCALHDWMDLTKAVLSGPAFLKWLAFYKEECRVQGNATNELTPRCL